VPVRLEEAANEWNIEPTPRVDDRVRTASIRYDNTQNRFIISFARRFRQPWVRTEESSAPRILRHARFLYAHEFVHRFLFVERDGTFVRALAICSSNYGGADRLEALRRLSKAEEKLCNRVASELLVPQNLLSEVITRPRLFNSDSDRFWWLLDEVSSEFDVARSVALRQVARSGSVFREGACFLLVGPSVSTGAGRGGLEWRVIDFIWPDRVDGVNIAAMYPGLPVRKLGSSFVDAVRACREMVPARTGGEIMCAIGLRSDDADAPIGATMHGAWRLWHARDDIMIGLCGTLRLRQ
jgi:hypothetical protein